MWTQRIRHTGPVPVNPQNPMPPGAGNVTPSGAGAILISWIHFDPPGADAANQKRLNRERVTICNVGESSRSLAKWTLRDGDGHEYRFHSLRLGSEECLRLHSGTGADSQRDRYWGSDRAVWDNAGDRATLRNRFGEVVDRCSYKGSSRSPKHCL